MKTYERRFETTHIDLGRWTHVAEEVIAGIEKDTLGVFRPDDASADDTGAVFLNARATLPVSIREWLPVCCQYIRWGDEETIKDHLRGWYQSNACAILWPESSTCRPPGPGSYVAGITLRANKCISAKDDATGCNGLKFLLAHELVHAIHEMRFVVPAFLNWSAFWHKALNDGKRTWHVAANIHEAGMLMDTDYGDKLEVAAVAQFWPSKASSWFAGVQVVRSVLKTGAPSQPA